MTFGGPRPKITFGGPHPKITFGVGGGLCGELCCEQDDVQGGLYACERAECRSICGLVYVHFHVGLYLAEL